MKVAIFTDNDFDKVNGVTTTLSAVLRYAPSDIQPRIYTAAARGADAPDYLAIPSVGMGIPFYTHMRMYVPHWRRYLDRVRADGIDALHLTTPGPLGLVAAWIAAKTGLPLVGSFHTDLAAYTKMLSGSEQLGYWMSRYMRWLYGRCQQVLVPSESTRQLMIAAKSRADRLRVWERGVDTALFAPARRSELLRRQWGASDERLALLYVGRLSLEKGVALLPPIHALLRARGIEHRLVLTGDGPMRRELAARCPDAIFTGELGREDVAAVFASADLFVFPSRTDTAGNVVLEAQASGLPVLVSEAGGPQENMRRNITGRVCHGTQPAVWVDQVAAVLSSANRRASMAASAREYATSRRWDAALAPLYQAYREVAGGRATRAA